MFLYMLELYMRACDIKPLDLRRCEISQEVIAGSLLIIAGPTKVIWEA